MTRGRGCAFWRRLLKWVAILLVVAVVGIGVWLLAAPPALLRVGSGYVAKIVCSNVFVAGRDPRQVLAVDVQAPGDASLRYFDVDVEPRCRPGAGRLPAIRRAGRRGQPAGARLHGGAGRQGRER